MDKYNRILVEFEFLIDLDVAIFKFIRSEYNNLKFVDQDIIKINNANSIYRGVKMAVSYNKLWKLLIDKNMKKSDLRKKAGISSSTLAKLTNGENVTTDVLVKICTALQCDIGDIMEFLPDESIS